MKKTKKIIPNSEKGFILIACLLTLTILSLAGMYGIRKSSTELSVVRNEGQIHLEFYDAEAGLVDALENYTTWMTNSFLLDGKFGATSTALNYPAVNPVATIQVRAINSDPLPTPPPPIPSEDNLPVMPHIGPPPADSGYSYTFERRNYGVTATSTDGNTQLQVGSWKVFNKF